MSQFADSTSFVKLVAKLQVWLWFRARINACIFHYLQIYNPAEIIVPSTVSSDGAMSTLVSVLKEQFPQTTIQSVKRK